MSALYRMAFSTHKQVEIGAGDKVILSASAVPGNEVTVVPGHQRALPQGRHGGL